MAGSPVRLSSGLRKRGTLVTRFLASVLGSLSAPRGDPVLLSLRRTKGQSTGLAVRRNSQDRDVSTELRRALELNTSVCLGSTHPHKIRSPF